MNTSEQVVQHPVSPDLNHENIITTQDQINGDRRYTGSCKWFNVLKGYGFIILDDSDEDIFVHQSELKMPGFRSLEEGERVAFNIRLRPGNNGRGKEAWEVGPEDTSKSLIGSSIRPLGNKRDKLIRCFKCGKFGNHLAQRCKKVEITKKICYACGSEDHLFNACPKKDSRTKKGTKNTAAIEEKSDQPTAD